MGEKQHQMKKVEHKDTENVCMVDHEKDMNGLGKEMEDKKQGKEE